MCAQVDVRGCVRHDIVEDGGEKTRDGDLGRNDSEKISDRGSKVS